MAKKKKTQLKPVARGFATTSVPKKTVQPEEPEDKDGNLVDDTEVQPDEKKKKASAEEPLTTSAADEFDPEKVDEQSLQNLVDKLQEKTEKEITRTVKAIEIERRSSQLLPEIELDPNLRKYILFLVTEVDQCEGQKLLDEPEEKLIARLAITYGVLKRLGFSESRVEECLRNIKGVDLDEAYDWIYLHCTEDEVGEKVPERTEPTPPLATTPPLTITPPMPQTSQLLVKSSSKIVPSSAPYTLDVNAPPFIPGQIPHTQAITDEIISEKADFDLKSRILASLNIERNPEYGLDPVDDADSTAEYVRLKLRYDELAAGKLTAETRSQLKKLQTSLGAVKEDYFFDEHEAELLYRAERQKAEHNALQERLRSLVSPPQLSRPPARKAPKAVQKPATSNSPKFDIFDADEDDSEGSPKAMFELLDDIPTETNDHGSIIGLREMPLPKHWSGRTPKRLLQETVAKADRYAAITYTIISGSSRAKRAAVNIRWEGNKIIEWHMEDVACPEEVQAEQYIATIALHELTYPPTESFSNSIPINQSNQTFFRLLPAVFRDLWDELEKKRKEKEDKANRNLWGKLRTIVEPKIDFNARANVKSTKIAHGALDSAPQQYSIPGSEALDHIKLSFQARQANSAYQEMLVQRNKLPIASYREKIIEALNNSQVLVLSGETGCGKSTQVPSFILEDQLSQGRPCKIYCTEPRRISAISLAQRVSRELGDAPNAVGTTSSLVGYSIRLESNISRATRLAFVTNGIALRMLEGGTGQGGQGTAFDEITHIIIDEVHERTIESDFLLIVLKSLLEQRSDLKVVLMSATMDAEKISDYFGGCPTLHIPGRTFPVDVQYLEDAVEYSHWVVTENSPYARRSYDKFYKSKNQPDWTEVLADDDDDDEATVEKENMKLGKRYTAETAATLKLFDERLIPYDLIMRILEMICFEDESKFYYSAAILVFMPGLGEIRRLNDILMEHPKFGSESEFRICPLHSTLSSENQSAVFDIPPPGIRKIVIATNIAETGITIPDITCVIDSGKHREMRFDEKRQISRLVETFIAKSNAAQRRGRAGRIRTGLCFHLFTKLRHDTMMQDSPLPEMLRLSLSDLALRIKIMRVKMGSSIEDVLSRAMDPPLSINIQRAISMLVEVRALTTSEEITPMGRLLSALPTDVHLGKFLLVSAMFRCLDPALTIAAALNSKSPFVSPMGLEQEADRAKNSFRSENSDFMTIHNAFASWRRASANPGFIRKFCRVNYLSHQNLQQIEELRQQFLGYLIDSSFIQADKAFIQELNRGRYGRNRTRFVTVPQEFDFNSTNIALVNAALVAGLYPKILSIDRSNGQMRTITNNQQVSFHPSSVNFGRKPLAFGVNHLNYFTLMHSKKLYAWETAPVDDLAMLLLCGECDFRLTTDVISIDRRIRFRTSPKTNIALKFLRSQLNSILSQQFRGKPLTDAQVRWNELAMMVLGKVKTKDEAEEPMLTESRR